MPNSYTLITAAGSSIGKDLVHKLAASSNLILHGRSEERLKELVEEVKSPNQILKWVYDLSDVDGISQSLSELIAGTNVVVDRFVHCAGFLSLGALRTTSLDRSRQVFNINFFSAVEVIRVLTSKVNNKGISNIVLVSALSSLFGERGNAMYVASKSALDGLVRSLATELAPNTRINSVLPGGLYTTMTSKVMAKDSALIKGNPLGEGDVADVTGYIEFLLSDKSRWVTGQNVVIDGGRSRNIFLV